MPCNNKKTHATQIPAAALSTFLADDLLDLVVNSLLAKLQSKGLKADLARTYMQAVGQIRWGRTHKLGVVLNQ